MVETRELFETEGVRPVVQTRYHRYTFDPGPEGPLRLTINCNACCRVSPGPLPSNGPDIDLPLLDEGCAIMEFKTAGLVPVWLRRLAGERRIIPRSFSK